MIARDGWTFILIGLALTVIMVWTATRWDNRTAFVFSLVFAVLTVFTAYFFRDPDRTFVAAPGLILSPADGKVVQIITLDDHPLVGKNALQVSIFLSVFDVHVNRVPATGRIEYVNYNPGKFFKAYEDKASMLNEQTEIGMVTDSGAPIAFKQIAGIIARRIVCLIEAGDQVAAGERFGLIRFGSRADVILPAGTELSVELGDRVYGGESAIAHLVQAAEESGQPKAKEGTDAGL